MQIDVAYIIIALVGVALGGAVGGVLGYKLCRLNMLRIGLAVKNPEMWDLLHHYVVDEVETKKYRRTGQG